MIQLISVQYVRHKDAVNYGNAGGSVVTCCVMLQTQLAGTVAHPSALVVITALQLFTC